MATKVKVAVRLRPFIDAEYPDNAVIVSPAENTISVVANQRGTHERFKFSFASCYDQSASQEEIFESDVKPLVEHVLNGLVCTVFAYGVTSSGKTHTIQGNTAQPGIIFRVVKSLIEHMNQSQTSISLSVSYMEIYKDDVYDLLVSRENAPKLSIREYSTGKIVVGNLSDKPIRTFHEFEKVFSNACKSRSTGATNLNHASSRSHALLAITVTQLNAVSQKVLTGKINLVDLAGSENNKLTGNDPARMAESAAINKSLTVLGQVVHALNTKATRIPYRDSKLTRILQDALGGTSVGLLICNLAPGMKFRQDTLNTLNFASRTKEIENVPTTNERVIRLPPHIQFAAVPAPIPARPPLVSCTIPGPSRMSVGGMTYQHLIAPSQGRFGFNVAGRNSIGGTDRIGTVARQDSTDIDEKISRAVQKEVERRLAEREAQERERLEEFKRKELERIAERERYDAERRALLTKKNEDLNNLLKKTLRRAEKENQKTSEVREGQQVLSPKKAKKLAMAYVALGRDYLQSKEPDYNGALKLWTQAETYVPENKALKKRIMELQVAIREGMPYRLNRKRQNGSFHDFIDSPCSGSPSGSRDHKESGKMRRRARLALVKERGELTVALRTSLRTPSPRKKTGSKNNGDVFVEGSEELAFEGG